MSMTGVAADVGYGEFVARHVGPGDSDVAAMLAAVGAGSMDSFIDEVVPASIRMERELELPAARSERVLLRDLREIADKNKVFRSCIGMGYVGTVTPGVIGRNVFENPQWYTQYTPYQPETAQGRLEALLNFQTMVCDLTGLPLANSSMLDEGTSAAEAMAMCVSILRNKRKTFYVADDCHPQTIGVMQTRGASMGINVVVQNAQDFDMENPDVAGILISYPTSDGRVECWEKLTDWAHENGSMVVAAVDLLSLTLLTPPGEWGAKGADIVVGSAQRFGVPMGFGGPHAGFMATREAYVRKMPGRLVGMSVDSQGEPALRLAVQTREQHIKRDRATSNICTAQVLLAVIASMYGVYHGPDGLKAIAQKIHSMTEAVREGLGDLGFEVAGGLDGLVFDTLRVQVGSDAEKVLQAARDLRINLRDFGDGSVGVTMDETGDEALVVDLIKAFGGSGSYEELRERADSEITGGLSRTSAFMTHAVFNSHRSETEMLRYITELQSRELSLAHSMIPLGSCTMKLNATSEMVPVSWREFAHMHPFAPVDQCEGYFELFEQLEAWLGEITGFEAVSLMPNAGSQGEYAGLLAIRGYHESRGDDQRNVCLIPQSAHGTNPASAVIAGMKVVAVKVDESGAIVFDDLIAQAEKYKGTLAAAMITYPSTCGVFDDNICEMIQVVHDNGGLVYLDGANMNAQVGMCRPGDYGADVCHLNLHKTFCIPHGGGGPGMGPIGVNSKLKPFLPGHGVREPSTGGSGGAVSAAPEGSPSILPISWVYIALMGKRGLTRASQVAVLNANYMAERLKDEYDILFRGSKGRVAHEFVMDCRAFKKTAGIEIDDIAKRLIDFGFHAPTMSWPVAGTLMVEPTESESKAELDRFCDAMITIRQEIRDIEEGAMPREDNPLKGAPHSIAAVGADQWTHPYSRDVAAYPAEHLRRFKFWAPVGRVDNPYGDRNLVCSCVSVDEVCEG